ncbi:MAG: hypothetical protein ABI564_11415 [Ideonella sp.]
MNYGLNPPASAMIGQLLVYQMISNFALKTCNPLSYMNVDVIVDATVPCAEPRLDPLEFHGQRRSKECQS